MTRAASGVQPAAAAHSAESSVAASPGEVLLRFCDVATAEAREEALAALHARQVLELGRSGTFLVRLSNPSVESVIQRFATHPAIESIEPNVLLRSGELPFDAPMPSSRVAPHLFATIPSDPYFSSQWALRNTGQSGGTPGVDIGATLAWDLTTGSHDILIAITDTGLERKHPDLANNVYQNPNEIADNGLDDDGNGYVDDVRGWDFVNGDNDPADDNGHGTSVAGVIAAEGNSLSGIAGVAWRAALLPLKTLNSSGTGTAADAILALDYATTMHARLTVNCWGGGSYSDALLAAIRRAHQAGVLFLAIAGGSQVNLDVVPQYPACYDVDNIIVTAGTDHNDSLGTYSSWGLQSVDLGAPGTDILTTATGSMYRTYSGTSYATAHVAGTLALLFTRYPALSGRVAKTHLLTHTHPVPSLAGRILTGGRLDAYAALAAVPTGIGPDPGTDARPPALRISATNPARSPVDVRFELPAGGGVDLWVCDVRGRVLRRLTVGTLPAGAHAASWDGRDAAGRAVSSGVYIVLMHSPAGSASQRLVFLGR